MMQFIWSQFLSIVINILPGFVLRILVRPAHISRDLEIDLRSTTPLQVRLDKEIPDLSIWLRFTNKSAIPILVDRVLFEVWFGQPYVEGAMLKLVEIRSKQTLGDVQLSIKLSGVQDQAIRNWYAQTEVSRARVNIYLNLFCDCKVGRFMVSTQKELPGNAIDGFPPKM